MGDSLPFYHSQTFREPPTSGNLCLNNMYYMCIVSCIVASKRLCEIHFKSCPWYLWEIFKPLPYIFTSVFVPSVAHNPCFLFHAKQQSKKKKMLWLWKVMSCLPLICCQTSNLQSQREERGSGGEHFCTKLDALEPSPVHDTFPARPTFIWCVFEC